MVSFKKNDYCISYKKLKNYIKYTNAKSVNKSQLKIKQ